MRYKTGMYGGSFDPLHTGHLRVILQAASQCERLYVVLSYSRRRDHIPMEYRFRWLRNSLRHMEHIKILLLEDQAGSKEEYDEDACWQEGRDRILAQIKAPVDAVFCGSDYQGTGRYEELYRCPVVYFNRDDCPVSSSDIRRNPFAHWDYIPQICRPWYVKKILLIGGESTGKSTLAQNLALHYNTNFLEEIGREVCDRAGAEEQMAAADFYEILLRQKLREQELLAYSNKLLFVDTDALTTKFYARFLLTDKAELHTAERLADAIAGLHDFDLIFFLEPTVAFVQDGTRNVRIEAEREKYSRQIKQIFDEAKLMYHCLSGDYLDRFNEARHIIDNRYSLEE